MKLIAGQDCSRWGLMLTLLRVCALADETKLTRDRQRASVTVTRGSA